MKSSENIEIKRLDWANLDGKKNMIFTAEKVDEEQKSVKIKTSLYTKYCINLCKQIKVATNGGKK